MGGGSAGGRGAGRARWKPAGASRGWGWPDGRSAVPLQAPSAEPSATFALIAARTSLALTTPGAASGRGGGGAWGEKGGSRAQPNPKRAGSAPRALPLASVGFRRRAVARLARHSRLSKGRGRTRGEGEAPGFRWSGSVDAYRPLYVV